jgi:hypothetical protein
MYGLTLSYQLSRKFRNFYLCMTYTRNYENGKHSSVLRNDAFYGCRPYIYIYIYICVCVYIYIYRMSQEESTRLRENVPYVKVHRYYPKHLHPKLNGYGDNGQRKV